MITEELSYDRRVLTYVQAVLREIQPSCAKCLYWSDAGECRKETPWPCGEEDQHGFWVVTLEDDFCGDLVMLNPDCLLPEVAA